MFSGVSFYEPFIYQLYNMFFTSNPIMYFAIFDFEHPKDRYLKDAKLYSLGFKSNFITLTYVHRLMLQ